MEKSIDDIMEHTSANQKAQNYHCSCGKRIKSCNLSKHLKSNKHVLFLFKEKEQEEFQKFLNDTPYFENNPYVQPNDNGVES
jgi:hypothetical protein